jgi:hypothetical protein
MKRCLICDEIKSLCEFHKAKDKPDGHRNDCKECRKTKRTVDTNSSTFRCFKCDEVKDKTEENFNLSEKSKFGFRRLCKECNKISQRKNHLVRNYKLTVEEYDKMVESQNSKCLICENQTKLFVDHDHSTGLVRGLLCDTCNRGIGYLKENKNNFLNSIKYLNPDIKKNIWGKIIKMLE